MTLLILLSLFYQFWDDTDGMKALRAHVNEITLSQNEGRSPGSEGETAVAAYVWEQFKENGLDVLTTRDGDIFGVARPEKHDTLTSRNVLAYIRGYDPELSKRYIVVAARMDNIGINNMTVDGENVCQIFHGANANASGVAMLLELSAKCARGSVMFKRSLIFLGLGSSTASFAGAWHFLHHTFKADRDKIDAVIDLDALGIGKNGMMVFTGGNGDLNSVVAKLANSLQPIKPALISEAPYPVDYQVFYASQIPSVLFTTGRFPEHNTPKDLPMILDFDFMEREGEYIYNFLLELANGPKGFPAFRTMDLVSKPNPDNVYSWAECDVPPAFMHNPDPNTFLTRWVYSMYKYPEDCIRDGVQGRVMVGFIIRKNGKVDDVHIVRGVDPQLDSAAVKAVKASPKWDAGKVRGQKVDCSLTIPVEFRLKRRK